MQRGERGLKTLLPTLMTMDYVRVRKDTLHELKSRIEKKSTPDWHVVAAVFGMVVAVAVAGLVLAL